MREENVLRMIEWGKAQCWHDDFICGWLANTSSESAGTFNPTEVQHSYLKEVGSNEAYLDCIINHKPTRIIEGLKYYFDNDRIGWGLWQHTSPGRKEKLEAFYKENNLPFDSLESALKWFTYEITLNGYGNVRRCLKDKCSLEECTRVLCEEYERPKSMQTDKKESTIQNRITLAKQFKEKYFKERKMDKIRICLDAGHYGKYNRSPVVSTYWESDFTWMFTNFEAEALRRKGFEVIVTRSDKNKDLDLVKRGKTAKGCDLFISNHSNACGTESVNRVSVIYPESYNNIDVERNRVLAELIADNCSRIMGITQKPSIYSKPAGYDRNGNKKNDDEYYGVMHGAQQSGCPLYMIVEHSFHTNHDSALWLLNSLNVKKLAEAEANVISVFFGCEEIQIPDATTPTVEYKVKKGDTLSKIADNFNTTVEEIMVLNPTITNKNVIYPNQILTIPTFLIEKVDDVNYIVQKGDTLSEIAKNNGTTVIKLQLLNGIVNVNKIYPGQVLRLK